MLNAIDKQTGGRIKFRRIAENRMVVYQELLQVAKHLSAKKGGDALHFLIVGCGWIGMELLKALLWCFVRYDLVIDVTDREDVESWFYRNCPGLDRKGGDGYRINFLPCSDVHTFDVSRIANASGIDHAFVALGSDMTNMECAVYLRQAFRRMHRQAESQALLNSPKIHVVINHPGNKSLELIDHKTPYCIIPFMGGQKYYTAQTLLDYTLEKRALLNHLGWELFSADKAAKKKIHEFVKTRLKGGHLKIANHAQWRAIVLNGDGMGKNAVGGDIVSHFYNTNLNLNCNHLRASFPLCLC